MVVDAGVAAAEKAAANKSTWVKVGVKILGRLIGVFDELIFPKSAE